MKYIKPKKENKKKVSLELSTRTLAILEHYSKYTQYSQEEIQDMFLLNLLEDTDFIEWVNKQRYNKKILASLYDTISDSELKDNETKEIVR